MTDRNNPDISIRVWFRLARLMARMQAAISDRLRQIGISIPQCDVLTTLSEQEGVSQQKLAERLYVTKGNVTKGNISGLLDRLEEAGEHLLVRVGLHVVCRVSDGPAKYTVFYRVCRSSDRCGTLSPRDLGITRAGETQALRIDPTTIFFNQVLHRVRRFVNSPVLHKQILNAVQLLMKPKASLGLFDVGETFAQITFCGREFWMLRDNGFRAV